MILEMAYIPGGKDMLIESGKIDEIVYARLDSGSDLLLSIWEVCRQKSIRTGVLMDCTGTVESLVVQRYPRVRPEKHNTIESVDMPGPLEISAHGIIGVGLAAGEKKPEGRFGFTQAGFPGHDEPYLHCHIVASNSETTVCGHLMVGSIIAGRSDGTDVSHFTIAIGKVTGLNLKGIWQTTAKGIGFRHELSRA
jgi:predicted DNA-binding protein with PD1-like motif